MGKITCWFKKKRKFLLPAAPVMASVFIMLIMAGLTQSPALEDKYCQSLADDTDNDGMDDAYELFFGLDPASNDAGLDYDGDALLNIEEGKILTDPFCRDTDRDGFNDLVDSNAVSRAWLQWGNPHFTTGDEYEYAHPDWLLGAYKNGGEWIYDQETTQSCWYVSRHGGKGVDSLSIDLDRTILTNNLRYAVRLGSAAQPARPSDSNVASRESGDGPTSSRSVWPEVSIDLLDTNGLVIAENLFGNLLSVSNSYSGGTRAVASGPNNAYSGGTCAVASSPNNAYSGGTRSACLGAATGEDRVASAYSANDLVLILNVPLATFPSAAVIQLRCKTGELAVYEGLLYIDEDGDGLDADQERQLGTSDYSVDSNGNGINDYDECFNSGSSTNNPGGGGGDDGDNSGDGDDHDGDEKNEKNKKKGVIYVDQAKGNDTYTGRSSNVNSGKKSDINSNLEGEAVPSRSVSIKGPKKTVHGGLSIAETNDTIIIRSGTYNENLNIQGKNVKVIIEGNVKL